jgi:putative spermidine/putrescine transport system permease protein
MIILIIYAIIVGLIIILPTFIVIIASFSTARSFAFPPPGLWLGYYREFFQNPDWLDAVYNSVVIATASTLLTLLLVTPAAFGMVRFNFKGRNAANLLLLTPLMVPHIALALGYYIMFAPMQLIGTHLAVVLAHTALNIPIAFLIITASLIGFDRSLERAAANLGAGPVQTVLTITIPVILPGFAVAALFSFIHSFDETTIALFISGFTAKTLPRQMFESILYETNPQIAVAAALTTALACMAFALIGIFRWYGRRRQIRLAYGYEQ